MLIRPSERRMRYTEEKETKNNPKSHAVTARMRWERSAYLSSTAMVATAVRSSGRSLCSGSSGPGLPLSRLPPRFQIPDHLTTRLRLIIHMAQARILDTPLALASSMLTRMALFCSSSIQRPSIFPTNPHSFFFEGPPAQQPFRPSHAPFPQVPASALRTLPRRRFSCFGQDVERGIATPLPLPCAGFGPDRWSTIPHGGEALQRDLLHAAPPGRSGISSQERGNDVYSFRRGTMNQGYYLCRLHSWHTPFGLPSVGELRSPYGLPSSPTEAIIPCSVIQTHF